MNALDVQLQSLVKCLSSQKISYAIIGGIAVSLYGEPRYTADIDVNVILDKRDIGNFLNEAKRYGFRMAFKDAKRIAIETGVIAMNFKKGRATGKFDIILAENAVEFTAIKRAKVKRIGLAKIRVVRSEDLIIHKITSSRMRDQEDLKSIIIRQKGRLDLKYIQYWLEKIDKANNTRLWRLFKKLHK